MRATLLAALVAVALAAGFLFSTRASDRAVRVPPAARDPAPQPAASVEADAPEPAEEDRGEEPVRLVGLRGTAVVVDEGGRHLQGESGSFRTESSGSFEVTRGEWHGTIPAAARSLAIDLATFGGRRALPDPATVEIPEDRVVEVRFRWFVPASLRVLGEKGEELPGVQLLERSGGKIVPQDPEGALEAGPSPVTIPGENEGLAKYWVRARGHAWSRIAIWQGHGGERVVRLARAGALEARLLPRDPQVKLHLYRSGDHVLERWPDDTGLCRIEHLPPGRFELRAEADYWLKEVVMATAEVVVEPGETAEVTLSLGGRVPDAVPVAGTLHVDPRWEEEPSEIACDGGYGPEVELKEDGSWSVELVPGEHIFTAMPWMWSRMIDVGPAGTTEARLVVPPPCEVEVRLVDAVTGAPLPDEDDLYWHVRTGDFDSSLLDDDGVGAAEPGVWRFRAPVGTIVLWLWNDVHDAGFDEFDLRPGRNRLDLKAKANYQCDLALRDGGIPVPLDEEMRAALRATALDGDGEIDSCSREFPCRIWFTKAGRYRLSLPAIEGYEPIAPVEVEIAKGSIPHVEIALKGR